jgi:hypothetical protein
MTSALAGLGTCHVVTAVGLRPARRAGRGVLAVGGLATVMVAAFPQPTQGISVAHTIAAAVAFLALAGWPVSAAVRRSARPLLTPFASVAASLVLFALVAWFALEIHGAHRGGAERAAAGAESLWPLAVVLTTSRRPRRAPIL